MQNTKSETTGQKHISTLAEDIKSLISGISEGKSLNITDENMDVFLNNIKEAMLAWNTPRVKPDKEGQLRMSSIGKPSRQLWYDKHSPKDRKDEDTGMNLKFLYGLLLYDLLTQLSKVLSVQ